MNSRLRWSALGLLLVLSALLGRVESDWTVLWPTCVALVLVFLWRNALVGLLAGALAGALLLVDGNVIGAGRIVLLDQFIPIFGSTWKLSALLFTLILGGFVALIEASGGLQALIRILLGKGVAPKKRMQLSVVGMGFLVFFDGLANTMLIGRLMRSAADRCGVSRAKLAYLADATGSSIACLAFVSTWIAFQLSMIQEGFALVDEPLVSAYGLFFKSLPTNFYCWFTLVMVFVSVCLGYNPGPMAAAEKASSEMNVLDGEATLESPRGVWFYAVGPVLVLTLSVPLLAYYLGADHLLPFSMEKFAAAYAAAENQVPYILVGSSVVASLAAVVTLFFSSRGRSRESVLSTFLSGVRELMGPVGILVAAWMLGAAISQLGAAEIMGQLLSGRVALWLLPAIIFILGSIISFSTGTSWGTIGVLMPLAISVVFELTEMQVGVDALEWVVPVIGAVFSGAVFGDHCSPFSDTTVVASVASGVEPMVHVRTQLPFALITAGVAVIFGFVPYGLGIPAGICLLVGSLALILFGVFGRRERRSA